MKKKSKIGFISLGCPKNQVDTEVMLADVVKAGYEVTPDDTEADIVIINTCAFIESAKQEAIDNILDVAWLKEHENLKGIGVTGCLAERYQTQIFALHHVHSLPFLCLRHRLPQIILQTYAKFLVFYVSLHRF